MAMEKPVSNSRTCPSKNCPEADPRIRAVQNPGDSTLEKNKPQETLRLVFESFLR